MRIVQSTTTRLGLFISYLSLFHSFRVFNPYSKELRYFTVSKKMSKRNLVEEEFEPAKKAKSDGVSSNQKTNLPYIPDSFQATRARLVSKPSLQPLRGDCVVYWMSRDQRIHFNHAFHYAQQTAIDMKVPFVVVFNLVPRFLEATIRQFGFMLKGLEQVEKKCHELNIDFRLLKGDPTQNIPSFIEEMNAMLLVSDFSPLRVPSNWVKEVGKKLEQQTKKVPYVQIDAHNVVPCWIASPKLEYSARTLRGKITPRIPEYLTEIPEPTRHPFGTLHLEHKVNWIEAYDSLEVNREVSEVTWLLPGEEAAKQTFQEFVEKKLQHYGEKRNDPNENYLSNLSPYLHFGQISAQYIVYSLKKMKKQGSSVDSFIEELVVRRELADNFCFYNPNYDNLNGCYEWAKETLTAHRNDPRPHLYSLEQLERGLTADNLWNAAQLQMTREGKMHEWTPNPEIALQYSIFLNDKYELDGRDPNGYVGCMWSIGGIHDQGWAERAVFGKIRYMNYEGCKRKFNVQKFESKYNRPSTATAASSSSSSSVANEKNGIARFLSKGSSSSSAKNGKK